MFNVDVFFISFEYITEKNCWVIWQLYAWHFVNRFPKQLHHFTFPRAMYEGSDSSTSLPTLLFSVVFIIDIPFAIKWFLNQILMCISFMSNHARQVFLCLVVTCISSLGKSTFKSFAYFSPELLILFYYWVVIFWI
jgi:hypothetical protein